MLELMQTSIETNILFSLKEEETVQLLYYMPLA